ncbi:RNA-splicing ligase RtcB [Saccharopolyspora lacisalsi]|uniref:3'-phosphate/5'-hydroxy nucleic acid ligase n=1 Tax=Halosaccharopolyspora lacisalsi TaxID=1000566 RepID=A0A839DW56_9PSEU|nr:RNA-splicing ligase RtcB [Halosaccharopolyspora lacisalsi]
MLIPGSMGTSSYVLTGVADNDAFYSTCHGAGRPKSRHQMARSVSGKTLQQELEARGIAVRGTSRRGLAAESPDAYKDATEVVKASEGAGLCRTIARLTPLGVVKG